MFVFRATSLKIGYSAAGETRPNAPDENRTRTDAARKSEKDEARRYRPRPHSLPARATPPQLRSWIFVFWAFLPNRSLYCSGSAQQVFAAEFEVIVADECFGVLALRWQFFLAVLAVECLNLYAETLALLLLEHGKVTGVKVNTFAAAEKSSSSDIVKVAPYREEAAAAEESQN
ncbi:hypothetical protein TSAR_012236 [Trichomalopsis sarcophagae]|uniref:Uncharacterized protein n=1 Tax=Trichomalopsis sarcophagae TaxID=543379 RepID=A0A232FA95_9HYME|nr:hypothetical protein TSAR_012236 [Trichomalopsis sarcophagae]